MKEHKRYIERGDLVHGSHLEVSVYYTKGGMSYFTGQASPRGNVNKIRKNKKEMIVKKQLFAFLES